MLLELEGKDLWDIVSEDELRPTEDDSDEVWEWEKRASKCITKLVHHVQDLELAHIWKFADPPKPWLAWKKLQRSMMVKAGLLASN